MHANCDCLLPTLQERLAQVQGDLRMGLPCLLERGEGRAIVVAIETLSTPRFAALREMFGTPHLLLTAKRAQAVMTPAALVNVSADPIAILPPDHAPLAWFQQRADPGHDAEGGPVGPFHILRDSEGELQNLAIQLLKAAELLPAAAVFNIPSSQSQVNGLGLHSLPVDAALTELNQAPSFSEVAAAGLPLEAHDQGKLHVFRDPNGTLEHYALEIGTIDQSEPVLTRLHSACFTGDVLGSLKCDCGPQLRTALARMGEKGAGVLLYLNQEGRGIGLANKMRVYDLQAQGFDTVEANHRLGYDDDERDFRVAAVMMRTLGIGAVRLLTNNPAKTRIFEACGIEITEQLPLRVGRNLHNHHYLEVKALKSGHCL